ncbi:MAG: hypothetical protein QOG23_533 [Blastocatellia bacterium]|jgi:hypothetical protein|nr:hypothetical protein [Blastocatellia bacterium]
MSLAALFFLRHSFDSLTEIGLLTVPHVTVAMIAWQKYPNWWIVELLVGCSGTVSEINKADHWLHKNRFVSADRRLFTDYVWEMFLKSLSVILKMSVMTLGVILLLGAIAGSIVVAFVGISQMKAMVFFGLFAVPLVGTILYFIRMNHRLWYGVSEIVFALFLAVFTIYKSFDTSEVNVARFFTAPNLVARILALSTSIYVVVRGWDNIGEERAKSLQSLGKQQLKTVFASLLNRIRRRQSAKE